MGMLMDAAWVLIRSALALVQLVVAGFALSVVYVPVALVVGAVNIVLVAVRGRGFSQMSRLIEPLEWYLHQIMVLFAMSDDFRALPYA